MATQYRLVAGLDGYRVGDDGTVWSCHRRNGFYDGSWRPVSVYRRKYGSRYCVVGLRADAGRGKVVTRYVHRLVLEAFVGPCPEGMQCLHDDGDTSNNRLPNLSWGTPLQNAADRERHGTVLRGCRDPKSKLTQGQVCEVFRLRRLGWTHRSIADHFGVSGSAVSLILRRKTYRDVQC